METKRLVAFLVAVVRSGLGRWDVIDRAMDDTGRTVRLIVILTALALQSAFLTVLVYVLARR